MKHKIFIGLLLILLSCKTEEDKYPEMALFEPTMKSDFVFEEVSDFNSYYKNTENYIFYNSDKGLIITNKKSKEIVKELVIEANSLKDIAEDGTLFVFNEKSQKAYKYVPPAYNQVAIENLKIEGLDHDTLIEKNKEHIKNNNLTGRKLYDYIDSIKHTYIKDKYIKNLNCALLVYPVEYMILRYPNKDVFTKSTEHFFQGTIIKSRLKGIESCNHAKSDLDNTEYFDTKNLKLLESITTDYNFSGSNHYVMGVSSSGLYYYEMNMGGKKVKFKSPYPIESIANREDKIIIKSMNKFYNVRIKK